MTFCLDSIIIKPENGIEIRNAIILLHGYGGDGKDISMLSLNWKRHMPNTVFICPNGHEQCTINPTGYQWFDLTKEDSEYILDQSIKAEDVLKKFIDEVKKEFKLSNNQICFHWLIFLLRLLNLHEVCNKYIRYSFPLTFRQFLKDYFHFSLILHQY